MADPTTLSDERNEHYRTVRSLFLNPASVPRVIRQYQVDRPATEQGHASDKGAVLNTDHRRALQAATALPGYTPEQQRNIGAALYARHAASTCNPAIDSTLLGKPLPDGRQFLFARRSPWGEAGPHFTSCIEIGQAARVPAEQSLGAAESVHQRPIHPAPVGREPEAPALRQP